MGLTEDEERHAAFSRCWDEDMPRVLRYAQRHADLGDARDITAEVFAVAWRRWSEVPQPALPWLIEVAHRIVANTRRASSRRRRLHDLLRRIHAVSEDAAESVDPTDRLEALRRLGTLTELEREVVLLVAWDGLSGAEAARVLGLTPAAFRKRLSRARAALRAGDGTPNNSPATPHSAARPHPFSLETS